MTTSAALMIHQPPSILGFGRMATDLEALEHVQVLLPELEVLGQQAERLHLVELSGSEEAKYEVVVRSQETDVWPRHNHVPHLQRREPETVNPQLRGSFRR